MTPQEFRDLGRLACKRTRDSAMTVAQLLDDDAERAALLVSVALDFIRGATEMLADDEELSEQEALGTVLGMIFSTIGMAEVARALNAFKASGRKSI